MKKRKNLGKINHSMKKTQNDFWLKYRSNFIKGDCFPADTLLNLKKSINVNLFFCTFSQKINCVHHLNISVFVYFISLSRSVLIDPEESPLLSLSNVLILRADFETKLTLLFYISSENGFCWHRIGYGNL